MAKRRVGVLIAAGGSGTRMKSGTPKQFLAIGKKSILETTIGVFNAHPAVDEIVIATPPAFFERVYGIVAKGRLGKVSGLVAGGAERQDSVWNGLTAFVEPPSIILVHDAVRPFVTHKVISDVIAAATRYEAAVVGVRVKETLKAEETPGFYARTIPRENVWAVQTPQGFSYDLLVAAHSRARVDGFMGTDEASLVERLGVPVRIVEGSAFNMKITTPEDLVLAQTMSKRHTVGRQ